MKYAETLTLPTTNNYVPNALNQYSSITNPQSTILNPGYDFDGNMTSGPLPVDPNTNSTLVWHAENRLISTTVGTNTKTTLYDSQSRRIAETVGTDTTLFIYDAFNCIAEYSRSVGASPTLQKTRLWGIDLSGSMQGAGGVGGLLTEKQGSNFYYPTCDGNGNVSEYLDSAGSVVAHYEYDPFGNITVATGPKANDFAYRFSTKPLDQATGLYYYGYRYYDPVTGRWPSRDPIEERGGVNLYGMVGNDAVGRVDILGAIQWEPQVVGGNIGVKDLKTGKDEEGFLVTVKTDAGNPIETFLGVTVDPQTKKAKPNDRYFCHGLTFGGKGKGPGKKYLSPLGDAVPTILADEWTKIDCCDAKISDIAIFWKGDVLNHSATFNLVVHKPADGSEKLELDLDKTTLLSKHGVSGSENTDSFQFNISEYSDKFPSCYKKGKTNLPGNQ